MAMWEGRKAGSPEVLQALAQLTDDDSSAWDGSNGWSSESESIAQNRINMLNPLNWFNGAAGEEIEKSHDGIAPGAERTLPNQLLRRNATNAEYLRMIHGK